MEQKRKLTFAILLLSMGAVQSDLSTMFFNFLDDLGEEQTNKSSKNDQHNAIVTSTPDMIREAGYPVEEHEITTSDGYILTLHRIPGKGDSKPIFLQHGLLGSSADWIMPGKGKALAYILSDKGYDVWLGNARGNTYSRRHKTLSTKSNEYWNFSFHEMGLYDLPEAFSYIKLKNPKNMSYIGHSMGTAMFYVMASNLIPVSRDIDVMISLAPIAYVNHMKSPVRYIAPFANNIQWLINNLGQGEFLPQSKFLKILSKLGCELNIDEEEICANSLFLICGFDKPQFNYTLLPIILDNTPAGTSTKTLAHFGQEVVSKKFRAYDYGITKNMEVYGNIDPPDYDLTQIQVPVALYYADNDWLASPIDVLRLSKQLPNILEMFKVNYPQFNHLDFIYGIDTAKLLYPKVISTLESFKN